jgi:hypothetical protein
MFGVDGQKINVRVQREREKAMFRVGNLEGKP